MTAKTTKHTAVIKSDQPCGFNLCMDFEVDENGAVIPSSVMYYLFNPTTKETLITTSNLNHALAALEEANFYALETVKAKNPPRVAPKSNDPSCP